LTENAKTDESRGSAEPPLHRDIRFNNVEFAYPERPDVLALQNVSFRIRRNECVAIVGTSGSGKSTIASLLQRLYEPSDGTITIGNADISSITVQHLREHVSVVSQFPNLFNATIAENIAYGNKSLSRSAIERAGRAAHVHDFIMLLPKGYDTVIGDNATLVSGGQAQRIQIARALARPSSILILDECTSALDPANQLAVMDTIRAAKVGRTTIVITHKLQVMHLCDRIIVVHEGEVVEEGNFPQLMHKNGVFARLARGGEWTGE
jgi:ATP-binding cassette subfamily B (MDR/TAP) protein 1